MKKKLTKTGKFFTKFPHIDQYRQVITWIKSRCQYIGKDENGDPIYDSTVTLPHFNFTGTVKIHGTNASLCERNNVRWAQSRNNIITPMNDNAGFAFFTEDKKEIFDNIFKKIYRKYEKKENYRYIIFGEWFGKGVQSGVAVSQLSRKFAIFDIIIVNDEENDVFHCPRNFISEISDPENDIFNVFMFKTFTIDIDLAYPEIAASNITKMVYEVEEKCPVGEYFGVNGIGEGIVWSHYTDNGSEVYRFKTKGEKHVNSKVKSVKQLITATPEEIEGIQDFVEYAVTENRLNQGLHEICIDGPTPEDIKPFITWVVNDSIREEIDTIKVNKLNSKKIVPVIQKKARDFILKKLKNI